MALFHECMPQCAQKELDTADIVRDAILRQLLPDYMHGIASQTERNACVDRGTTFGLGVD